MANAVSHDQNFKNLIVDYPVEALALFASREAPAPADDARVTALRQEQLKERLGDRFRALDTPLRVEWTGKRRKETLFVMEEVSDWTGFSAHHLARYCLDLSEMYGTERVVPVAIFLRDAGRARRSLALGTGRQAYLRFGHLVAEIGKMPVERWIGSDNLVARVNLPNMRGARDRKVEVYGEAVRGLLKLEPDPLKRAKYLDFIDIYADLTDNERERYKEQYPEENEVMAGIVQRPATRVCGKASSGGSNGGSNGASNGECSGASSGGCSGASSKECNRASSGAFAEVASTGSVRYWSGCCYGGSVPCPPRSRRGWAGRPRPNSRLGPKRCSTPTP